MVNRGEEEVRVHLNVVPRSTRNTHGVSPSKGNQGTTTGGGGGGGGFEPQKRPERKMQAPVVQRLDNPIQRINRYPVDTY